MLTSEQQDFVRLFEGNRHAHGADWGQSVPEPPDWTAHFDGTEPTGIYPMYYNHSEGLPDEWMVRWGCVDLDVKRDGKRRWDYEDEDDAHTAALNLVNALKVAGTRSFIEVTKSHGRHVWVFSQVMPARTMRRGLLVACQLADVPPTEVNPKAEGFDDPDTLGNYVRIPYVGGPPYRDRYMVDPESGLPTDRQSFVYTALMCRDEAYRTITDLAELWVPPVSRVVLTGEGEYDGELNDDVTPYIRAVLTNGPTDGRDRSGWLWWLAGKCADEGLTPECALAVLTAADETWTRKYVARKDGEARLVQIIEKVY